MVDQSAAIMARPGFSGHRRLLLLAAIAFLSPSRPVCAKLAYPLFTEPLCIVVKPPLLGGVSNSLAVLNTAQLLAVRHGDMRLVIPTFRPAQPHGESPKLFDDMFTGRVPPFKGQVSNLPIPILDEVVCRPAVGNAACFVDEMFLQLADGRRINLQSSKLKTYMTTLANITTPDKVQGSPLLPKVYSGCKVVLQLQGGQLRFNHNYVKSRGYLFRLYHGGPTPSLPSKSVTNIFDEEKINVAIHHRLGDVLAHYLANSTKMRKEWLAKLMSPQWALFSVITLASMLRHPQECLKLHIFTDAQINFPDILRMGEALERLGLDLHVHGQKINAKVTLDALIHADVLVAGRSGYSRVAGMLSDNIKIAPSAWSHPVYGLPGFVITDKSGPEWTWNEPWTEATLQELLDSTKPWAVKFRIQMFSKVRTSMKGRLVKMCGLNYEYIHKIKEEKKLLDESRVGNQEWTPLGDTGADNGDSGGYGDADGFNEDGHGDDSPTSAEMNIWMTTSVMQPSVLGYAAVLLLVAAIITRNRRVRADISRNTFH